MYCFYFFIFSPGNVDMQCLFGSSKNYQAQAPTRRQWYGSDRNISLCKVHFFMPSLICVSVPIVCLFIQCHPLVEVTGKFCRPQYTVIIIIHCSSGLVTCSLLTKLKLNQIWLFFFHDMAISKSSFLNKILDTFFFIFLPNQHLYFTNKCNFLSIDISLYHKKAIYKLKDKKSSTMIMSKI